MFVYQRVYIWKMNLVNWDSMGGSPGFFFFGLRHCCPFQQGGCSKSRIFKWTISFQRNSPGLGIHDFQLDSSLISTLCQLATQRCVLQAEAEVSSSGAFEPRQNMGRVSAALGVE